MNKGLKDKILELRSLNMSYKQIREQLGCTLGSISRYCSGDGINDDLRHKAFSEDAILKIRDYYKAHNINETSAHFKVSKTSVCKYTKGIKTEIKKEYTADEIRLDAKHRKHKSRKLIKQKCIDRRGGKCIRCGNTSLPTLDFHHLDPNEKEFNLAGFTRRFESLLEEVDKCVILCKNCHAESHAGLFEIEQYIKE